MKNPTEGRPFDDIRNMMGSAGFLLTGRSQRGTEWQVGTPTRQDSVEEKK